jgi:hypothetical protein
MSYKYSTGSVRRGDIYFEDDTQGEQTYIDFGYDTITLRPSGSAILFAEDDAVGIGTTNPQTTLHVKGDPGQFRVEDTTVDYAYTIDCDGDGIRTHFGDMTGGGDEDSFMSFGAYTGINRLDTAARDFHIYGTNTTTGFYFDESEGKFGIGTTTPANTLHVYANASDYVALIDNDASSTAHGMKITSDGTGTGTYLLDIEAASTTLFRFRADGRLGIGTTTPGQTLTVDGDIGIGTDLVHKGDSDTLIRFQNDDVTIRAGNVNFINFASASQTKLTINDSRDDVDFIVRSPNESLALYLNAGNEVFHINHGESNFKTKIHSLNGEVLTVNDDGAIFNEDGAAGNDFRVESDSNTHMLFVDAGTNFVGVGTSTPYSTLQTAGSLQFKVSSVSGDITLDATYHVVAVDCNSGNVTVTLPSVSESILGRQYIIKRADTGGSGGGNSLTIARNGANIDGAGSDLGGIDNGTSHTLICLGGAGWIIVDKYVGG